MKYRRQGQPEYGIIVNINDEKLTFTYSHGVEITYDVLVNDEIIVAYESMLEYVINDDNDKEVD